MAYKYIQIPSSGDKIKLSNGIATVPDNPIIPFIEGDGIGPDIWAAAVRVLDAAVEKAYDGKRKIEWLEVFAGEKANDLTGEWLPEETLEAISEYGIAIKGPLTTPVGGGIRSLNVALRQKLDLYVCLRPVKYYAGTPSPVKQPEKVDMIIFRENTEDIYAGIEFMAGTAEQEKLEHFLVKEMGVKNIRFSGSSLGIKPVSKEGSQRLIRAALEYAIDKDRSSVTLVHKGNIMKFTEGQFKNWGYELAKSEFDAVEIDGGPWCKFKNPKTGKEIIVKDVIADAMLQQIILRPSEYDVIATLNLNGDYISDALAAQVGGIGIAPGANIGSNSAIFEATHGTAPKYAGQDKVNPSSVILSAVMMFRYMQWTEAADMIDKAMAKSISEKTVTYDFHRLMDNAKLLKCSEFADQLIKNL